MALALTCCVAPVAVLAVVTSPGLSRDAGLEMDLWPIEPRVSALQTWPPLGFGDALERAAVGHAVTTPLAAPGLPVRWQGGSGRARTAFPLDGADKGESRSPVQPKTAFLATSILTLRRARGAVRPDCAGSSGNPPRRLLGRLAFRPVPPRAPAVGVHLLDGRLTHHLAVVQGPAAEARGQGAHHDCGGDGLRALQPGPRLLKPLLPLLLRGRAQACRPTPRHLDPETLNALGPMHTAGVVLLKRQTPVAAPGGDPGARWLKGV
jgi:hypothetical protein